VAVGSVRAKISRGARTMKESRYTGEPWGNLLLNPSPIPV